MGGLLSCTGLFSAALYGKIQTTCGDFSKESDSCNALLGQMHDAIGHVNVYDLYEPCIMAMDQSTQAHAPQSVLRAPATSKSLQRVLDGKNRLGGPDGCINAGAATKYLDNKIVQDALHVHRLSHTI